MLSLEKFDWPVPKKEVDKTNTDAYLEYFKIIASDFKMLAVKKEIESPQLNTVVGQIPHNLNGKADLYVAPSAAVSFSRNQLVMVFEMKPDQIVPKNVAQAMVTSFLV